MKQCVRPCNCDAKELSWNLYKEHADQQFHPTPTLTAPCLYGAKLVYVKYHFKFNNIFKMYICKWAQCA